MSTPLPTVELLQKLSSCLGGEHVLTADYSCAFYVQDVYSLGIPALAVVRPGSTTELATVVKATTESGCPIIPRGGGMPYTSGYVPAQADSVMVDMSQNATFRGSGQFGSAVDSVLGLEVVLADGSIVHTGSGAQVNSTPFYRHQGPDLTGLFTCDTGALGFKAVATLRLMPELPAREYVATDVKSLAGVMKSSGSVLGALKDGARVAPAERRYMKDVDFSIQVIIEERCEEAAQLMARQVREAIANHRRCALADWQEPSVQARPAGQQPQADQRYQAPGRPARQGRSRLAEPLNVALI